MLKNKKLLKFKIKCKLLWMKMRKKWKLLVMNSKKNYLIWITNIFYWKKKKKTKKHFMKNKLIKYFKK